MMAARERITAATLPDHAACRTGWPLDGDRHMFLTGTLLNVATVLLGTMIGLLLGSRMPERLHTSLTTALGLFTALFGINMGLGIFTDPAARPGDDLAVLAAVLVGVAVGELLRLHDGLEGIGAWFQRRLSSNDRPSRIAEGFVTASLVFCVGPLTILGSIANGLTGNIELLAIKSALDGVASIAFAATLGAGVALSAVTVLIVQGGIAAGASLLRGRDGSDHHPGHHVGRRDHAGGCRPAAPGPQGGASGELPAGAAAGAALHPAGRRDPRPPELSLARRGSSPDGTRLSRA